MTYILKCNPTDSPKSLAFTFGFLFFGIACASLFVYTIVFIDIFTTISMILAIFGSLCCLMACTIKNSDFKEKKRSPKVKPIIITV